MRTRLAPLAAVVALALSPAVSAVSGAQSSTPLDDRARAAIGDALADEMRAEAAYTRIVRDLGEVWPFSNVVQAERRHAQLLAERLRDRGLAVPEPAAPPAEPRAFPSLQAACAAALELEAQNVALYDRLLAAGPLPDDVRRVFQHNRMASLDHHRPAFERCAGRATARGTGSGRAAHPPAGARPGQRGCGQADQGCWHRGPGEGMGGHDSGCHGHGCPGLASRAHGSPACCSQGCGPGCGRRRCGQGS